ncbi:MAG: hypothetical protein J6X44_09100, partial [Thermoguttaceae bacterium]|nr:hypothetical protein [Thermoguttaceae bacterium]
MLFVDLRLIIRAGDTEDRKRLVRFNNAFDLNVGNAFLETDELVGYANNAAPNCNLSCCGADRTIVCSERPVRKIIDIAV